jgi:hypothetical protein
MLVQLGCGPPARRLITLPQSMRAECIASVRKRIAGLHADELVWKPEVLFAVAEKTH